MATKLNDGDLTCFAIDDDTAVIGVKGQKFVVDYSTLMDFLTDLAVVTSQVEGAAEAMALPSEQVEGEEICACQRLH